MVGGGCKCWWHVVVCWGLGVDHRGDVCREARGWLWHYWEGVDRQRVGFPGFKVYNAELCVDVGGHLGATTGAASHFWPVAWGWEFDGVGGGSVHEWR